MITCIAIDDDPLFLRLLETYFEEIYDAILVSTWVNPVRGALAIAKQKPDVVLLDFDMPYMDGFQMLDSLEDKPKIILISGHLKNPDEDRIPADLFFPKSDLTDSEKLHKAILKVMG